MVDKPDVAELYNFILDTYKWYLQIQKEDDKVKNNFILYKLHKTFIHILRWIWIIFLANLLMEKQNHKF